MIPSCHVIWWIDAHISASSSSITTTRPRNYSLFHVPNGSLIRSVGGLSKYFYRGLWLDYLNADVIGQSINRRGVALDFPHHVTVSSSFSARFLYGFPCRFQRAWTVLCSMKHPLDVVRVGACNSLAKLHWAVSPRVVKFHQWLLSRVSCLFSHPWINDACARWQGVIIFVYAPSQWETTLQCSFVFHWLGAHTKWSLRRWTILS